MFGTNITLDTDQVVGGYTLGSITINGESWNIPEGGQGTTVSGVASDGDWNSITIGETQNAIPPRISLTQASGGSYWESASVQGTSKPLGHQVSGTYQDSS